MMSPVLEVESVTPRNGVLTLFGYIKVHVDRGHLLVEDSTGTVRRYSRLARVGHGLKRLVIIGNSGFISFEAIRWLAGQNAAFSMLERTGTVLATTGPVRPSDARLRRAQALALRSGVGLEIARELITKKLAGQEQMAREKLHNVEVATTIARFKESAATANTLERILLLESQGAAEYWSTWEGVSITFPKSDLKRVPDHWKIFKARKSPLSGSQRLAVDPLNAILNYLYAVLESEARLAASGMGLDPGLGILHLDTKARDSLACDLMEPVRPQVDAFVLDWIRDTALKRDWFFEESNGNCRLMGPFAVRLSETALMWRRAVAPFAEWVARTLWSTIRKSDFEPAPATRLTQSRKREVKGAPPMSAERPYRPEGVCGICGKSLSTGRKFCGACAVISASEQFVKSGPSGRIAAHAANANATRRATQRRNAAARANWNPASQPAWLTEEAYATKIQPLLAKIPTSAIATALGISWVYAKYIRLGQCRPHPRHWEKLAELAEFSA